MDICNKHHSQYNVLLQDRAQLTDFLEVMLISRHCIQTMVHTPFSAHHGSRFFGILKQKQNDASLSTINLKSDLY